MTSAKRQAIQERLDRFTRKGRFYALLHRRHPEPSVGLMINFV